MRKFIVCLFALFAVGNAIAETMCVKLDVNKGCNIELDAQSDWTVKCGDVQISGVARCSDYEGYYVEKSNTLPASDNPDNNAHCWCRMISPAVSSWVSSSDQSNGADHCATDCAYNCAWDMYDYAFRAALFSDLH